MKPLPFYYKAGNHEMEEIGLALLKQGKLGCLILAGGEGTRLGWDGPKGAFPVTRFKKKSLFQLFCEKVNAAAQRDGAQVPLALMTSPLNHDQTVAFFEENNGFGVSPERLSFFQQGMLPLLDHNKKPTHERGPDGNGPALKYFCESGIFAKWRELGIEHVHVLLVDNALADPCDAELLGVHASEGLDWTVKCIEKESPQEKVGVLAEVEGRLQVIEYTELPKELGVEFALANTGMFCLSMDFIEHVKDVRLPVHLAKKKRAGRWIFKQETFLFELMKEARKSAAVLYDRESVFAPLKNKEGDKCHRSVLSALQQSDRSQFEKVTGERIEDSHFELDPAFYYTTDKIFKRWHGRNLPLTSYIDVET